jgi:DNA-binding protein Fis
MNTLFQVCVVIMTLALVATAYAAWRVVKRFEKLAQEISLGVDEARRTTSEAQHVIATLQDVAQGLKRGTSHLEAISHRAANISSMVLDEIEPPTRTAVAVARGLKAGAAVLLGRRARQLSNQFFNGGNRNV